MRNRAFAAIPGLCIFLSVLGLVSGVAQPAAPVRLSIQRQSGQNVRIAWPESAAGFVLAYAALLNVVPLLRDRATAGLTLLLLSAVTLPWAVWQAIHRWRSDRRCARTYAVVAVAAGSLLWQATRVLN